MVASQLTRVVLAEHEADEAAVEAVEAVGYFYATNPTQLGKYEHEPDNVITIGSSAVGGLAANTTYAILSDGDGSFTAYAGSWSSANGGTFTEATGTSGDVSLADEAAVEAVYATNPTQLGKYEHEPDNVITIGSSAVGGLAANTTYAILSDGDGSFTAYAGSWSSANGGTFTEATGTSGDVSLADEAAVEAVYATNPTQLGKYEHEPDNVITIGSSAVGGLAANTTYAILSDGDGSFTAYAGSWSSANGGTFTEATGTSGDVSLADEAAVEAVYATNPTQLGKYEHEPDNVITIGSSAVGGLAANTTYAILSDGDGSFTAYAGSWSSANGGTFTEATGTSGDVSLADEAAVEAVYATNPTQLGKYEHEPDNVITIGSSAVGGLAANTTYAILSDGDGSFTAYAGSWSSANGGTFTEATGTSGDVSLADEAAVEAVYATNPTQLGKYEHEPDNVITIGSSAVGGLAANTTYAILSDGDGSFTAYAGSWSSANGGTFTEATGTSGDVSLADEAAVEAVYATNPTQLGKYEHEPDNVITIGSSAVGGLAANTTYAILSDGDGSFTAYAGSWSSANGGTFTEATGTSGDVSLADEAAVEAVYATNPTQLGKYEHEPDNVITIGSSAVGGLAANTTYAILSDGDGSFTAYAGSWSSANGGTFTEATGTSGDVSLADEAAVEAVYATNPTQLGKYEHEPDNVITIGSSAVGGLAANTTYAILSDGDGSFTAYAGSWSSANGGTFTEATGTSGDVSLADEAAVEAVYATNPTQLGKYEHEPDNVITIGSSAVGGLAANTTYNGGTFTDLARYSFLKRSMLFRFGREHDLRYSF